LNSDKDARGERSHLKGVENQCINNSIETGKSYQRKCVGDNENFDVLEIVCSAGLEKEKE